jgi:hypothetical protein
LFGDPITKKEITCFIYHDERLIGNWLYHAFLFVPTKHRNNFLSFLEDIRQDTKWHKELHFKALETTRTENKCAAGWVSCYLDEKFQGAPFYLLGTNQENLAHELWDRDQRDFKIYNRFFQIGLYAAIKWFFLNPKAGCSRVVIEQIFSDAKNRRMEDRFHTQPIEDIEFQAEIKDEPITFVSKKIIEIDSDHSKENKYPEERHFVQLVDLLLGGFSQALDNTSTHEGKRLIAKIVLAHNIPTDLMDYNFDSPYYKKIGVSFFPKFKLSKKEVLDASIFREKSQFYSKRDLLASHQGQGNLFG